MPNRNAWEDLTTLVRETEYTSGALRVCLREVGEVFWNHLLLRISDIQDITEGHSDVVMSAMEYDLYYRAEETFYG